MNTLIIIIGWIAVVVVILTILRAITFASYNYYLTRFPVRSSFQPYRTHANYEPTCPCEYEQVMSDRAGYNPLLRTCEMGDILLELKRRNIAHLFICTQQVPRSHRCHHYITCDLHGDPMLVAGLKSKLEQIITKGVRQLPYTMLIPDELREDDDDQPQPARRKKP